ncbi:RNA recognition motif domain-containing protein [Ditylenchus destructor]|uniref:RNA recognition motif domain-containing protein n=1 Tax=Ditylenchus destructor TaxID=166010 RepID=A0AAD4N988_9BILA|nr:RNA recognition motif domain-containing protein [Ditylenchus destructor]
MACPFSRCSQHTIIDRYRLLHSRFMLIVLTSLSSHCFLTNEKMVYKAMAKIIFLNEKREEEKWIIKCDTDTTVFDFVTKVFNEADLPATEYLVKKVRCYDKEFKTNVNVKFAYGVQNNGIYTLELQRESGNSDPLQTIANSAAESALKSLSSPTVYKEVESLSRKPSRWNDSIASQTTSNAGSAPSGHSTLKRPKREPDDGDSDSSEVIFTRAAAELERQKSRNSETSGTESMENMQQSFKERTQHESPRSHRKYTTSPKKIRSLLEKDSSGSWRNNSNKPPEHSSTSNPRPRRRQSSLPPENRYSPWIQTRDLYVSCGGISESKRNDLKRYFEQYGEVERIVIPPQLIGTAFVRFKTRENAQRALNLTSESFFDRSRLTVNWAKSWAF